MDANSNATPTGSVGDSLQFGDSFQDSCVRHERPLHPLTKQLGAAEFQRLRKILVIGEQASLSGRIPAEGR
jgi:hypothetical protein